MGSAGVVVAILAAKNAAFWLGGWGILLISQPVVTIGLLFLVLGLALRWSADAPEYGPDQPAKLHYRIAAYGFMFLGVLVVADHVVKVTVFAMIAQTDLGIFAFLPALGPKLPIGLAAMFLGLLVLRRAPRAVEETSLEPSAVFRSA